MSDSFRGTSKKTLKQTIVFNEWRRSGAKAPHAHVIGITD
jgi:hypothetical protein